MSRTTITVTESAYEHLRAHKEDDESWSDLFDRAADALADDGGEHGPNEVAVLNVDELARATADEVEDRMTRR